MIIQDAFWARLEKCRAIGCAVEFWCPSYEARRTTKACENRCPRYGECALCEEVLETEGAVAELCETHGIEHCTVCGRRIFEGDESYGIDGTDECNCSEDCLNVVLDSLYGVRRWQKHDIGNGETRYAALIKDAWRPLPVEFSVMQRRPEPCAMTRKALY